MRILISNRAVNAGMKPANTRSRRVDESAGNPGAERTARQETTSSDDLGFSRGRAWWIVTGLLLVTMPALTLGVAYAALTATRSVIIEQLTLVEAVELYLVELAAFAVFSYLLYRLTWYTSRRSVLAVDRADEERS